MKANEIKQGGIYTAKVSGKITKVKVLAIRETSKFSRSSYSGQSVYRDAVVYDVTNLSTGRRTTFKSAAKFRAAVGEPKGKPLTEVLHPGDECKGCYCYPCKCLPNAAPCDPN